MYIEAKLIIYYSSNIKHIAMRTYIVQISFEV